MKLDKTLVYLTGGMVFFMLLGYHLPKWAIFLATVSLCYGTVVLGMILLVKSGLVSFGNGFYYCIGAYTAGTLQILFGVSEIMIMISSSIIISAIISFFVGYLLRNYRDIFFAMLSLAISMILYGLLAKSSVLGSTDGFNLSPKTFLGMDLYNFQNQRYVIFALTLIIAWICASIIHLLIKSPLGKISEAIKDNELRVEYIGESVRSFGERFKEHLEALSHIYDHSSLTDHISTIQNFSIVAREDQDLIRTITASIYTIYQWTTTQ